MQLIFHINTHFIYSNTFPSDRLFVIAALISFDIRVYTIPDNQNRSIISFPSIVIHYRYVYMTFIYIISYQFIPFSNFYACHTYPRATYTSSKQDFFSFLKMLRLSLRSLLHLGPSKCYQC